MLGKKEDLHDMEYQGDNVETFYLHKGEIIEIYDSTLHYTPMQVDKHGFSLGVILLKGTNTELDGNINDMLIKRINGISVMKVKRKNRCRMYCRS